MSAQTLVERAQREVIDLEFAITSLRAGIAEGGLSLAKQRWLLRQLKEAPRLLSELSGAVDAYRTCAMSAPGLVVPALDPDARPLHVSDEEMR